MPDVTLTVPSDRAERFQREAARTLKYAASNLEERLDWLEDGKASTADVDQERATVGAAEHLYEATSAQGGEISLEADEKILLNTIDGCLAEAGEDLGVLIEAARRPGWVQDIRRAMAEIEMWVSMRENIKEA